MITEKAEVIELDGIYASYRVCPQKHLGVTRGTAPYLIDTWAGFFDRTVGFTLGKNSKLPALPSRKFVKWWAGRIVNSYGLGKALRVANSLRNITKRARITPVMEEPWRNVLLPLLTASEGELRTVIAAKCQEMLAKPK